MNAHYTYFLILGLSLIGPLLLSFDKRVAFYKQWKWLFAAMLIPALIYIAWDSWFTSRQVWSFNAEYIVGKKYAGLPVEEILFFFVVPYCCVFIYECMRIYFPALATGKKWDIWLPGLAILLLPVAIVFVDRDYTASTAGFTAIALIIFFLFRKKLPHFNSRLFVVSYLVTLVPFLVVNGFLTALPVVLYNDAENVGIRIYTIPVEDVFYGLLLVFLNIVFFEIFRNRK